MMLQSVRPPLKGKAFWKWRLRYTPLDQIPWIIRRVLRLNHVATEYYKLPQTWEPENLDRTHLNEIIHSVRGQGYPPMVFVHGIMPRSGSNIVHDVLEAHSDVVGREVNVSEFPFLCSARSFEALYASIIARHREVAEGTSAIDMMAYLAAGWMKALQQRVGLERTIVLKMPSVQHLALFPLLFPNDYLIIVLRDGRDLVQSSRKTWKGNRSFLRSFTNFAREYAWAAEEVVTAKAFFDKIGFTRYKIVKFEDYVATPEELASDLFKHIGLSDEAEAVEQAGALPVRGSSELKEKDGSPTWQPIEKPTTFNPVGRWSSWSDKDLKKFTAIAGQAQAKLGYGANTN